MKARKTVLGWALISVAVFCFAGAGLAQEIATKEECVAKVKEAVKLIKEIGAEEACKKIMEKGGPFIWKDSYVFCTDNKEAKVLAHPAQNFVGFPLIKYKDADGKEPFTDILETAKTKGEGWQSYMHLKPGAPKPLLKTIYFVLEPDSRIIVSAGYYKYD
jgi:cytochrome c